MRNLDCRRAPRGNELYTQSVEMKPAAMQLSEDEPENHYGYWVDLNGLSFDEGSATWIQAMPFGEYEHPLHGKIKLTPERAQRFATNVKKRVRETDLDIDYDHKMLTTEAAGWIKDAEARDNGLWILVEWTQKAFKAIKDKAYRYFSPEFVDQWKNPKTGEVHKDVLFGGGLTNRPFLKDILPINLSDLTDTPGGESMDRKTLEALAKRLGVEFTSETTDEELQRLVTEAAEEEPEEEGGSEGGDGEEEEEESEEGSDDKQPIAANDLLKLAETNPAVKTLLDRVTKLEASNQLAQVDIQLSELNTDKRAIAPKALTELRTFAISLNENQTKEFFKVVKALLNDGVVALGEHLETEGGDRGESSDVIKRFNEAAQKLMDGDDSLSYADAVEQVSIDDPQLYNEYRRAAYMREEV